MLKTETRPDGTRRVSISFDENVKEERSRTKPEFHKDTNINVIMKKYRKTGILGDPLSYRQGQYGDFTSGDDFAEAMRKLTAVQGLFNELPAHIRTRFGNDPRALVDFLVDPQNDAEAVKMGLKNAPPVVPSVPTDAKAGQPGGPPSNTPAQPGGNA